MNSAITENQGYSGLVFYDAQCPLCQAGLKFAGPIFQRRGFQWRPAQTSGLAARLMLPEAALLEEMKLQLPNGRILGGVNSWIHLFRSVWWLWPLGFLMSLPGVHAGADACYRWIARNRYCVGRKCHLPMPRDNHHWKRRRDVPFMDLP